MLTPSCIFRGLLGPSRRLSARMELYPSRESIVLSTQTRLRVEFICESIAENRPVSLSDMAWIQKWSDANPTVAKMLRQARRAAISGEEATELDDFCNAMDLGDPDPSNHLQGPQDPIDLAQWFTNRRQWFRGNG